MTYAEQVEAVRPPVQMMRAAGAAPAVQFELDDTKDLAPFTSSQFKDIFKKEGGRLLSVRKDGDEVATRAEFAALESIKKAGLPTPNAALVQCTHKGKTVWAIEMDEVKGTFVDINKLGSSSIVYKMMVLTLQGEKVDASEHGILKLLGTEVDDKKTPRPAAERLKTELTAILSAAKELVINDLQVVLGADGSLVIIDPQWAGTTEELKADKRMVMDCYQKVYEVVQKL